MLNKWIIIIIIIMNMRFWPSVPNEHEHVSKPKTSLIVLPGIWWRRVFDCVNSDWANQSTFLFCQKSKFMPSCGHRRLRSSHFRAWASYGNDRTASFHASLPGIIFPTVTPSRLLKIFKGWNLNLFKKQKYINLGRPELPGFVAHWPNLFGFIGHWPNLFGFVGHWPNLSGFVGH